MFCCFYLFVCLPYFIHTFFFHPQNPFRGSSSLRVFFLCNVAPSWCVLVTAFLRHQRATRKWFRCAAVVLHFPKRNVTKGILFLLVFHTEIPLEFCFYGSSVTKTKQSLLFDHFRRWVMAFKNDSCAEMRVFTPVGIYSV